MTPEQRRRIAAGLMAEQYNRPTPQDTTVTERAGLLPIGTYANGMTGLALPGFVTEPVESFNRLLKNGYTPGDAKGVEDAFNVAGAAMMGGIAAPKPAGVVGSAGGIKEAVKPAAKSQYDIDKWLAEVAAKNGAINEAVQAGATGSATYKGYSGSETNKHFSHGFTRGPWASSSPDVAGTYAGVNNGTTGNIAPMEFRFKNPSVIEAGGNLWREIPVGDGLKARTNELANSALNAGNDGIVFKNVRDDLYFGGEIGDVYHALRPGTTYSALTGNLLYANGGKQGAAAGAALNALLDRMQTTISEAPATEALSRFVSGTHEPITGYRGSATSGGTFAGRNHVWASSDPQNAAQYALDPWVTYKGAEQSPSVMPMEFRFKNPMKIDAQGRAYDAPGLNPEDLLDTAARQGHDGLVVSNYIDPPYFRNAPATPQTTIAAIKRGTVYSPLTGDLLYANGGRQGAAAGAAVGGLDNAPGIRAYHGSPHDFDKFDMSKIGTGEGAQAFGHGLYFAENEGVAKSYRDKLSNGVAKPFDKAQETLKRFGGDRDAAIKSLEAEANSYEASSWMPGAEQIAKATRDMIDVIKRDGSQRPEGRMYEVNIKANPDDFLDWDKPLSQQSEKVQQAFQGIKQYTVKGPNGYDMMIYPFGKQPDGQSPHYTRDKALAEKIAADRGGQVVEGTIPLPDKNGKELFAEDLIRTSSAKDGNGGWFTSEMLREAGLPGIRYLDQGSRAAGEGSSNYVVFDDKLIEILRKYGLAGFSAGGAAYGLLGNDQPSKPSWNAMMRPGDA